MINLDGLYLLVATVTSIPTPYRLSMPRKVVILMLYTYMLSWMPLYVLVEDPFIGSLCLVTVMTGALLWLNHVKHVSRSEEHTSELQSLMRISYAVFCLKKKTKITKIQHDISNHTITKKLS